MPDLLDASVWVALSTGDHSHYARSRRYWDEEASDELAFCRLTALALLRHLTSPRILGEEALDGSRAWRALTTWLAVPRITLFCWPSRRAWMSSWGAGATSLTSGVGTGQTLIWLPLLRRAAADWSLSTVTSAATLV